MVPLSSDADNSTVLACTTLTEVFRISNMNRLASLFARTIRDGEVTMILSGKARWANSSYVAPGFFPLGAKRNGAGPR